MIQALIKRFVPGMQQTWAERHFLWIIGVAALLFMGIALSIGVQQSVWFDEAYSILLAKQSSAHLVHLTALDTHPPFYYLLLKGWATLFGWSELALRSLSVLASGGALVFAALTVRRMFNAKVALYALPFIILAPFLIRYGFEIRMYALASLIGMMATYVLVRAYQTNAGRDRKILYIAYATLVALGMYTLYYLALLWIAHVVWLVWMALRDKQSITRSPWLYAYMGSILLFLPWLPAFISQTSNGALAGISQPMTIDNLIGLASFGFLYQPVWQLGALSSLVVVGVIVALVGAIQFAYKNMSKKQKPFFVLLALYLAVPVIILTLVSLLRPMYVERYLAHVWIGGMAFIGVCIAFCLVKLRNRVWIATSGALVGVLVLGSIHVAAVGNYNFQRLQTPMIDKAAAILAKECSDTTTIFAADPYVATELSYYTTDCPVYFYSKDAVLRGGYAPLSESPLRISEPQRELATAKKVLYVYYDTQQVSLPTIFKQSNVRSFESLHIATFSAE